MNPYRPWATAATRLILIAACLATLLPVAWIVIASISVGSSLYTSDLIPRQLTLAHYQSLFTKTQFLLWLKNSLIVCGFASFVALGSTVTTAYAFSRFRFPGRRYGLLALLLLQMIPSTVTVVAIYRLLLSLRLLNTFAGLILVYGGMTIPFNAWIMRGYFDSIPIELEESAYMDGASHWQAFWRIVLPLAVPMMAVVFVFNLISFYSEYILASIVLSGRERYTIALGLRFFDSPYGANWAMFSAAAVAASLPVAAVFYRLQRHLVDGLSAGAVKG